MQAVNDEAIQVENLKIRATLARAVRILWFKTI